MRLSRKILNLGLSSVTLASLVSTVFVANVAAAPSQQAASSQFTAFTRTITRGGSLSTTGSPAATGVTIANPEIADGDPGSFGADSAGAASNAATPANTASTSSSGSPHFRGVNRSLSEDHGASGTGSEATQAARASSQPQPSVTTSFDGINHRQNRLASGGNQFSLEPPDQGMCASSSWVFESVNDAVQVYSPSGTPQLGGGSAIGINAFYGYAPAINRTTGARGQFVTDPSCLYDQQTGRWFNLVLTLEVNPRTGAYTGANHLDLAVSQTSDPRGAWVVYRIPVQDNGTDGTPNHGCSYGFCFGDYPHIGADANGIYLTTNEYSFFGPEFHGAQIYVLSKQALAAAAPSVTVTQFDTTGAHPGFTIWPAQSSISQFVTSDNGTEYFLSSTAADEVQCPSGCTGSHQSDNILQWTMSNTASLNSGSPSLTLSATQITVPTYAEPPASTQKTGPTPLADCLNDTTCATFLNGETDKYAPEQEYKLDSNDSRMQQVTYANGKLWGALDAAVTVNDTPQAGIAYYIVNPNSYNIVKTDQVGLANTNLTYPAIGVLPNGKGVVAFTLSGTNDFPSAAYASLDALNGFGAVQLAASGVGPADGFTGYKYYGASGIPGVARPRWGDYGAAAVVGDRIWIASEYIGQSCTLAQYEAAPFGSCSGTRTALANWDTRISQVNI